MPAPSTETPLAAVLARFAQRRPVRAGSLIVTVFGDAIALRGGSLWLGSLLEIMELFGIEGGLVRTALSRLVQEGWFERSRGGKNSYYRLSPEGAAQFADATQRIYHAPQITWGGSFRMALLTSEEPRRRTEARDRLAAAGFGQAAPTLMLRPGGEEPADGNALGLDEEEVIWLSSRLEGDWDVARRLAAGAWKLEELGRAYQRFIAAFAPLASLKRNGQGWSDDQAFRLRILLIHEYRRIILRDPLLPRDLLPPRWPGLEARDLCRTLYRQAVPGSERWLDAHAASQAGPLPPPPDAFWKRFG